VHDISNQPAIVFHHSLAFCQTMTIQLKKLQSPTPVLTDWDSAVSEPTEIPPAHIASLPSPPTAWLSARDMKVFGSTPLKEQIGIVKCKQCDRPVLRSAFADHYAKCSTLRAAFAKKGGKGLEGLGKGKKRKAEDEIEDPTQTKKKKQAATKVTKGRFKGPVDYDKQCGVINDKGLPCSRSLSCKSHSMGAKRSVQGRSKPYDELLLEWNRANKPNFVEPVKKESKLERKERKEKEKAEKKKQAMEAAAAAGIDPTKKATTTTGTKKTKKATTAANPPPVVEDDDENVDDLDSEAEMDSLISAVQTAQARGLIGTPLAGPCDVGSFFVVRRERLRSCRGLYENAFKRGGGTTVGNHTAAGVTFRPT